MTRAETALIVEAMSCNATTCLTSKMQRLVAAVRVERAEAQLDEQVRGLEESATAGQISSVVYALQTWQNAKNRLEELNA